MKRFICIILATIWLAVLPGCAKNSLDNKQNGQVNKDMPYTIHMESGTCYLAFKDGYISSDDSGNTDDQELARHIYFCTVEEMINDIQTGNFSDKEMEILTEFSRDENGMVKICDISSLYVAEYPSTFSTHRIVWGGMYYYFSLGTGGSGPHANLDLIDKETYESKIDFFSNFDENPLIEEISVSSDPERNAVVYDYVTSFGDKFKLLFYAIGEGTDLLYIAETYAMEDSDIVPGDISIWGQSEGKYFDVYINRLQERPSVEWLSQFGIREYVKTEVA